MALSKQEAMTQLKENFLSCMAAAALGGHELGEWQPVESQPLAFQAVCHRCQKSVYASYQIIYSILDEICPAKTYAT